MGWFNKKSEFIGEGLLEVPEAKVFHIPSKLDLKTSEFELKSENVDQRVLLEIIGMLTGAECKRPLDTGKLEFTGERTEAHIEINPADTQAKIDKISKIQSGEDVEIFDLNKLAKKTRLPHMTHTFRCPSCEQSVILYSNNMTILRDIMLGTEKSYSIPLDMSQFPQTTNGEGFIDHDKVIDIYNDCIELLRANKCEVVRLISDSEDDALCPICGKHHMIKDFVKKFEGDINENKCDICGGAKDDVLTDKGLKLICSSNDCYSRLNKVE